MTLIVHHLQVSQSERIPWLCEELGINYDLKTYKRSPMLAPPEYKALHPIGAAPVIQDGNLTLAESGACVEYIAHRHGAGKLMLNPSHKDYVDFLYWWHWSNGTYQSLLLRVLTVRRAGVEGDLARQSEERLDRNLKQLDDRLAANDWLAGTEFTAADIMVVFSLSTMRNFIPYDLDGYPNILTYLKRVGERPAYQIAMRKSDPDMELALGAKPPLSPSLK